jgi:transposase InsO family protein
MDARYVKRRYLSYRQPGSFSGLQGFFQNSAYKDKSEVEKTLSSLYTYNLHRPVKKKFKRQPYFSSFIDHIWTSDTIYYPKYKYQNRQHSYILIVVDTFSKFLWCYPLKNKKAEGVRDGLLHIIKVSKRKPQLLHTDKGTEYYASSVKELLKEKGIRLYSTHSPLKAMIAERMVRTLKSRLERIFTHTGKNNWIDHLDNVVYSINNTINRSIKMKPAEVNKRNEGEVWHNLYKKYIQAKSKPAYFKVGDYVKIANTKLVFDKGYTSNYSKETFIISEISKRFPVTMYRLTDAKRNTLEGQFYEPELIKVETLENHDE